MKKYIYFLAIFGLTACETETYKDFTIENDSSSTIMVRGTSDFRSTAIEEDIEAGNSKTIIYMSKFGKSSTLANPEDVFRDDFIIVNSTGDTLQKDYKLIDNWDPQITEKRATTSHKYTLRVSDSDF